MLLLSSVSEAWKSSSEPESLLSNVCKLFFLVRVSHFGILSLVLTCFTFNQKIISTQKHCLSFKISAHCEAKSLLLLIKSQQFASLCTWNIIKAVCQMPIFCLKIGSTSLTTKNRHFQLPIKSPSF